MFFTCHPADFERSFAIICDDLFAAADCAVYYKPDMSSYIPEESRETDLGRMNLFIIPVSLRLLTEPNPAMDMEFSFATVHHIPVLPIMLENGLAAIYSRSDRFGELQFLQSGLDDETAIPYQEKLKRYLSSVLIDSATAKRVQAAFDAYIFLSYRKKDRAHANRLMRLIHSNPFCRDIAIWYDEFLTPGESFSENIQKSLEKSDLFALLVTPNLVNEDNYVRSTEYPLAKASDKNVLPVEVEKTDKKLLQACFSGLPDVVDIHDEVAFRSQLLKSLEHIARQENGDDPAHSFLIGLAYLEGIDVEVDKNKGLQLVTSAAEAALPEAMDKLSRMYTFGTGVPLDYRKALHWMKRLTDTLGKNLGPEHPESLDALYRLSAFLERAGLVPEALETSKKCFELHKTVFGEKDPKTVSVMHNLAYFYGRAGDYEKKCELEEWVYAFQNKMNGEEDPSTIITLNNLAHTYGELGNYEKELELQLHSYDLHRKVLGDEHPKTLNSLNNLAYAYLHQKQFARAQELEKQVYDLRCKVLGEEHPASLNALSNFAFLCGLMGDLRQEKELEEKVYALQCRILGEMHPDSITTLHNLAGTYRHMKLYFTALELDEKALAQIRQTLGDNHPHTQTVLDTAELVKRYIADDEKRRTKTQGH